MVRKILFTLLIAFVLVAAPRPALVQGGEGKTLYVPLLVYGRWAPALKWAYGGCYSSWCETGWYSSPAAVDINGDGRSEIIASAYSLWALDGQSGQVLWSHASDQRTWPGIVVADINRDGQNEIVTAQSGGLVSAYRLNGDLIWQKTPSGGKGEFRGLLAADLDGNNGPMEIVVTRAYGSAQNTYVLDSAGNLRAGWPQLVNPDPNNPQGYAWGVYNANAAAANMLGDSRLELVVPSDVHYINAYEPDGSPIPANSSDYPGKTWGLVGLWESMVPELRGWGECNGVRAESYRANFAEGPAVITDLDGDGQKEVAVTGNMYDCHAGYPPSRYTALFLLNPDRSRYNKFGHDWRTIPVDTGKPLSESYSKIESAEANPAVADLDGDGQKEILFSSYDGKVHAFWLDKTEHGYWPYAVTQPAEHILRFASEPVVVDLTGDGQGEVIFTSWAQKGSHQNGRLHVLDSSGQPIYEGDLPAPLSSSASWNGGLSAPTLANVDTDPDLELIVNSAASGVVVYDLPFTSEARVLWGTGRGNFNRDGAK